jgi:hypothetical protein
MDWIFCATGRIYAKGGIRWFGFETQELNHPFTRAMATWLGHIAQYKVANHGHCSQPCRMYCLKQGGSSSHAYQVTAQIMLYSSAPEQTQADHQPQLSGDMPMFLAVKYYSLRS